MSSDIRPADTGSLDVYGEEWVGARDYQEDRFAKRWLGEGSDRQLVCILCDGMGGHAGGDVASATAVDSAMNTLVASMDRAPAERLTEALGAANYAIGEKISQNRDLKGMGCTFVALIFIDGYVHWISVGDSPMWLLRDRKMKRLNADHSYKVDLAQQVRRGEITSEQAAAHPQRNALTSAVMGGDIERYDQNRIPFLDGDLLILASDGIETLGPEQIAQEASDARKGAETVVTALMSAVRDAQHPKQDNTTILAVASGGGGKAAILPPMASRNMMLGGATAVLVLVLGFFMYWILGSEPEPVVKPATPPNEVVSESEPARPIGRDCPLPGSDDSVTVAKACDCVRTKGFGDFADLPVRTRKILNACAAGARFQEARRKVEAEGAKKKPDIKTKPDETSPEAAPKPGEAEKEEPPLPLPRPTVGDADLPDAQQRPSDAEANPSQEEGPTNGDDSPPPQPAITNPDGANDNDELLPNLQIGPGRSGFDADEERTRGLHPESRIEGGARDGGGLEQNPAVPRQDDATIDQGQRDGQSSNNLPAPAQAGN